MSIDRTVDTREARRAGFPKTTGSLEPIPGRCGHQLAYTGDKAPNPGPMYPARYCMTVRMKGKRYCRQHGGKSPMGLANPMYTGGQGTYGKALRDVARETYDKVLSSDELLSMREEIAVAKTWLAQIMTQLNAGELLADGGIKAARRMHVAVQELQRAVESGDKDTFRSAFAELGAADEALQEATGESAREQGAMAEFRKWALVLEKLEARENHREETVANLLSAEKAFALRKAESQICLGAILEFVQDVSIQNAIRRRIATELAQLAGGRDRTQLVATSGAGLLVAENPTP